MADFKITIVEKDNMPGVMKRLNGLGPSACMKCGAEDGLAATLFLVNKNPKTIKDEKTIKGIMKKQFNIEKYGVYFTGRKTILTTARCRKCQSDEIFWDY